MADTVGSCRRALARRLSNEQAWLLSLAVTNIMLEADLPNISISLFSILENGLSKRQ
ncbi:hypothetical protein [Aminobacter aminovorans]|uniref:hypothetical protein n=1 Tax=Aminobacter aminovorans TaxID=83263 RepID=UPI001FE11455|nr:hypothetical protein [Aminobacter aminovorans]